MRKYPNSLPNLTLMGGHYMQNIARTAPVAYDSYCDSPIPLPPEERLIFSHQSTFATEEPSKADIFGLYANLFQIAFYCILIIVEIITLPLKTKIILLVV